MIEIADWQARLLEPLRPYFRHATTLPYRLHWACISTLCRGETDEWISLFAHYATVEILRRQEAYLRSALNSVEQERHQQARIAMLRKLAGGPCLFRDLLRRYSVQKREIHEPILTELVNDGLVSLRSDGWIEISQEGRARLAA